MIILGIVLIIIALTIVCYSPIRAIELASGILIIGSTLLSIGLIQYIAALCIFFLELTRIG